MDKLDMPFGDYELTRVGYVIYAHNGFHLIPVRKDQQNPTVNTMWVSIESEPYVWTVEQTQELLDAAGPNNWKWKPKYVRKAVFFKATGNIVMLASPIEIGRLFYPISMKVEQVSEEQKLEYKPEWDVESETVVLAVYGCNVTIDITSRGEGDVKRGVEWVKRAIQSRLDTLKKAMEEDGLV